MPMYRTNFTVMTEVFKRFLVACGIVTESAVVNTEHIDANTTELLVDGCDYTLEVPNVYEGPSLFRAVRWDHSSGTRHSPPDTWDVTLIATQRLDEAFAAIGRDYTKAMSHAVMPGEGDPSLFDPYEDERKTLSEVLAARQRRENGDDVDAGSVDDITAIDAS